MNIVIVFNAESLIAFPDPGARAAAPVLSARER
jgi:hypothetical protein